MEETFQIKWNTMLKSLEGRFGEDIDLQTILFLIGLQELGQGYSKLNKNQKVDVMHVAVCALLSQWGYYNFSGHDKDGWPHWEATEKLPHLDAKEQNQLIKEAIVEYFN
tara:strand:+ start:1931 stop:2257 length:327 start_codon:yes stop_codon:yes gene_type:complete